MVESVLILEKLAKRESGSNHMQPEPIDSSRSTSWAHWSLAYSPPHRNPYIHYAFTFFFRSRGYHFRYQMGRYRTNHRCFALYVFFCLCLPS